MTSNKAQSVFNYAALFLVFLPIWLFKMDNKKEFFKIIYQNWWKYLIVSLADVEANFLIIKAYKHTLVTTIQVLFV